MQLLKLSAQNFCCFEKFELDLYKVGLVWVTGKNLDTKSADNNGSGKSTILKALTWNLYGSTIDGERGDGVIKDGATEAAVSVLVKDEGNIYTILRTRKKGAPSLGLFNRGEKVDIPKKELQEKINKMIGLDYTAFRNTVLYGQNDASRFADPRTKDSERKDVLHKILGLSLLKQCHEEVRRRRKETRGKLAKLENEISSCRARLQEQNIPELREKMNRYEDEREYKLKGIIEAAKEVSERIEKEKSHVVNKKVVDKIEPAKEKIAELKASLEQYNEEKAVEKVERLKRKARDANLKVEESRIKTSSLVGELKVFEEQASMLDTTNCPVCNSPLDKGEARKHVGDLLIKISELKRGLKESKKDISGSKAAAEKLERSKEKAEKVVRVLKNMKESILQAERNLSLLKQEKLERENKEISSRKKVDELKNKLVELERRKAVLKDEENPYVELLKKALKKAKLYNAQLKDLKKKQKKVYRELSNLEFWFHGFSNRGLPSFMLDGVMPVLSDRTNHYLETLADGDIKVWFSTQKEKKASKGEYRDEIELSWEIEGVTGYPPSGGQLKKIEIATDLALMDLAASNGGRAPDILALDEILDGLDDQGVQRVLLLLQELRKRRGSIFVISHDERMSEIFERTIVVKKKNGVSTLKVVA